MSVAAETVAAQLARAVDLFRDPARKEDQKQAFRAFVAMLQEQGIAVRAVGGHLWVNGAAVDGPEPEPLLRRLELHGVSEMTIPQDAPLNQVFALHRALAEQPGMEEDIEARLRGSGASHVSVSMARPTDPAPEEPPRPATPARPDTLGTRGLLRDNPMGDIASPAVPVPGPAAVHPISPVPDRRAPSAPALPVAPSAPAADLRPPESLPPIVREPYAQLG